MNYRNAAEYFSNLRVVNFQLIFSLPLSLSLSLSLSLFARKLKLDGSENSKKFHSISIITFFILQYFQSYYFAGTPAQLTTS